MLNLAKLTKQKLQEMALQFITQHGLSIPAKFVTKAFIDTSTPLEGLWRNGTMSLFADRMLALSNQMDNDGLLELYHFNERAHRLGLCNFATVSNTDKFLKNALRESGGAVWKQKTFAPIAYKVMNELRAKSGYSPQIMPQDLSDDVFQQPDGFQNKTPVYVSVLTDGDADDLNEAMDAFGQLASQSVYVMFVNISAMSHTARDLADKFDHVGYAFLPTEDLSDEHLFDALLQPEFVNWCAKFS